MSKLHLIVESIQERYSTLNEDIKFYEGRGEHESAYDRIEDLTIAENEEKELRQRNKGVEGDVYYVRGWVSKKKEATDRSEYVFAKSRAEAEEFIRGLVSKSCL